MLKKIKQTQQERISAVRIFNLKFNLKNKKQTIMVMTIKQMSICI